MDQMETVEIACSDMETDSFESAIAQLGYTVIDVDWNDEAGITTYVVKKKWLK